MKLKVNKPKRSMIAYLTFSGKVKATMDRTLVHVYMQVCPYINININDYKFVNSGFVPKALYEDVRKQYKKVREYKENCEKRGTPFLL